MSFSGVVGKIARRYYAVRFGMFSGQKNVECPCCGWQGKAFLSFGASEVRANALCPRCCALERHRLYYLYLKKVLPKDRPIRVLHFAPENVLTKLFRAYPNVDYLSADLAAGSAMQQADLMQLQFGDNAFDVIFCAHVLEHVPSDLQAMRELRRVLRPGGFAILQVPIHTDRAITFEDEKIVDPAERERVFGQRDHVRIYGTDYAERLRTAGFTVRIDRFAEALTVEECKKYGIVNEELYYCTKGI